MRILLCFVLLCMWMPAVIAEEAPKSEKEKESETSVEKIELEAVYLGINKDLTQDDESIIILQIIKSDRDDDLAVDKVVLCHWAKEDLELELDHHYQVQLSKKSNPSAVSWVLEQAEPVKIEEPAEEQETAVKSETNVSPTRLAVLLLDDGASWLLMGAQKHELRVGQATLHISDLKMELKVDITASDGTYVIISGAQLKLFKHSSGYLKNLQLHQ